MKITDREKAASLIARWLAGDVTNWVFEDEWPEDSEDPAVVDIGRKLWLLYSDYPNRLLQVSNLSTEEIALLNRCLSFVQSDEVYDTSPYEEAIPWKQNLLAKILGTNERPWETMRLKIDPARQDWWPFRDEAQWRRVIDSLR